MTPTSSERWPFFSFIHQHTHIHPHLHTHLHTRTLHTHTHTNTHKRTLQTHTRKHTKIRTPPNSTMYDLQHTKCHILSVHGIIKLFRSRSWKLGTTTSCMGAPVRSCSAQATVTSLVMKGQQLGPVRMTTMNVGPRQCDKRTGCSNWTTHGLYTYEGVYAL
jgi:hypothetical protein